MPEKSPRRAARSALVVTAIFLFVFLVVRSNIARADDAPAMFKAKCAMCHGPDGGGDTPTGKMMKAADLRSADVQKAPDSEFADAITKGRNKMPAVGKAFKPDEVKGLVAFVRGLAKK
jgi:mono/diheme cytochrome c family protein